MRNARIDQSFKAHSYYTVNESSAHQKDITRLFQNRRGFVGCVTSLSIQRLGGSIVKMFERFALCTGVLIVYIHNDIVQAIARGEFTSVILLHCILAVHPTLRTTSTVASPSFSTVLSRHSPTAVVRFRS